MTTKELYDYITSQIPPEKALMLLLQSSLIQYEKLKFDKDSNPVHPVLIISMAAMDMGWSFMVENDHEHIRGLTVGTEEYMNNLFKYKHEKN